MGERREQRAQAAASGVADDPHARELRILNAIAEALNSSADVRQALERTLELVADLLGLRTGWVWLLDAESGQFYSAAVRNLPPYLQAPVRMTGRNCWCLDAFREGALRPKNIDVMTCSRLLPAVQKQETDLTAGLRYHASIPLAFQDTPLGIMNVTGPTWRELSGEELRLLSTIAYQVGIAVDRARLAEDAPRLARAEERARIAREIHDTLAQGLTGITLQLEGALHHLQRDPERARERVERALATARQSLEEARGSVMDLRTVPLAGKPLAEALAALGRAFTSETGVRVHVTAAAVPALPLRTEAELFRIAQEALANVRSHAQATEVTISLSARDEMLRRASHASSNAAAPSLSARDSVLRLAIRDDGRGFDPKLPRVGHHGILGMRERAKLLGGRLRVASRPGRGALVAATVPLHAEHRA